MVGSLQDWRWAVSDDAADARASIPPGAPVATLARLRARWSPERIGVVAELAEARAKAKTKFGPRAATLAADRSGVEMASSSRAAAHKAARFLETLEPGATVLDACCGIGGDSIALHEAGLRVTALDLDERRAWMAGHNAGCQSLAADARAIDTDFQGVHIDPARRSAGAGGRRTLDAEDFEPPLSDAARLVEGAHAGAIKLNPGIRPDALPPGELEIISENGALTQAVLWTGAAALHDRRATLLAPDGSTHSLAGRPDRPHDSTPLAQWLHTMDPAPERADLVGLLIEQTGLRLVHPGTGLLTGEQPHHSPWLRPFRVLDEMAWSPRAVRARLRELNAGIVTIKARAGVVNPDILQRQLRRDGPNHLTVFILPIAGRVRAVITERQSHDAPRAGANPAGGASCGVAS